MRTAITFFLPWLSMLLQRKMLSGMACLFLQLTLIGWIPAYVWAFLSLNQIHNERRTQELVMIIRSGKLR